MRKTHSLLSFVGPVGLLACWPVGLAYAQALPNINSLSVRYNSLKTAAKAEGELKAQLDDVDKAIADARRTGNMGEVRRQIAKGLALLDKEAWTPQLDYRNSLVLRSERTVIDSSAPYAMRIEQIYRPSIELTREHDDEGSRSGSACRRRVPAQRPPPPPAPRELGTFDGVSRDLRETPFAMELDLAAVEDGAQVIEAEMFDGTTSLGAANLGVFVHKGLDAKLKTLEAAAATATPAVRADVLFPGDYIRNVNRGRIELADFNVGAEVARAETILARSRRAARIRSRARPATSSGTTCSRARTRSCRIASTCRRATSASKATPLVIALHGLGGNEDGFFDNYRSCRRSSPRSTASCWRRRSASAATASTARISWAATRRRGGAANTARRTCSKCCG